MNQSKKKETLRWSPVAILLVLTLVAPLFGNSPVAVAIPLLMAIILAGVNVMQKKQEQNRAGS
ncbi:hypothetical protein [Streptomyces violascens]|uniref:Uncharacterized protein n=1 Tax=Streptomyces violascens TaxID=67381 RepID=A0ABQ3QEJ7_9ACTN|nr:hypothetical protein [Streptomyces violascens]GGU00791.1 hypothetical protein GCM10010289_21920 [Streptomyces violascens]GHI35680.1 hypothetical protein Sviol_00880 [Streptomyces violascens]